MLGDFCSNLVSYERTIRPDNWIQALLMRIVDDFPNIGPHERLSACENENRISNRCNVVHDALAFVERQLAWIRLAMRSRPAMCAGQVATTRYLPRDDPRRLDAGPLLECLSCRSASRAPHLETPISSSVR